MPAINSIHGVSFHIVVVINLSVMVINYQKSSYYMLLCCSVFLTDETLD